MIESVRSAVMERDVFVAVVFFALEAVLLVWPLPRFLDKLTEKREERRRLPTRKIAAERIIDSIRNLLRAATSLNGALAVANSNAGMTDLLDDAAQKMKEFTEDLRDMSKRLEQMSGGKPIPAVPAQQPDSEK